MASAVDISSYVTLGLSLVFALICTNWVITYFMLRRIKILESRRPLSSLLVGFLGIGAFSIQWPIFATTLNIEEFPTFSHHYTTIYALIMIFTSTQTYILTFRAYMVYFDINWNKALTDSKWRLYIDPAETNWYLKHRKTWGNHKRIAFILCSVWGSLTLIAIAYTLYLNNEANLIARGIIGIHGIITCIIDSILLFKFPKFNDIWHISNEIQLTLKVELLLTILYFIVAPTAKQYSFQYTAGMIVGILLSFGFNFVLFRWVFWKFDLPTNVYNAWKYKQYQHVNQLQNLINNSNINDNKPDKYITNISIQNILQHEVGFSLFAEYLTREFCIENLLYFVETQQLLQSLIKMDQFSKFKVNELMEQNDNIDINSDTLQRIKFHSTAPKSAIIVHEDMESKSNNDLSDVYNQCSKLFLKYIANDAYFCINVSGEMRQNLYSQYGYDDKSSGLNYTDLSVRLKTKCGDDTNIIFSLFDESRLEVYWLLKSSFARFKISDDFQNVLSKKSDLLMDISN